MSYRSNEGQLGAVKGFGKDLLGNIRAAIFEKSEPLGLGRKHRPKYTIVTLVAALALIGMLVIFSIAPGQDLKGGEMGQTYFIARQFAYLVVGLLAFIIASRIPLDFWRRIVWLMLILAFGACLLLAIAGALDLGIAVNANGANRWLSLGPLGTFQPAEFMKFALMIFSASFLANAARRGEINSVIKTLLPLGIVVVLALVMVVVLQSDLSSGVVIIAIILAQLILSGMRWRNVALSVVPLLAGALLAIAIAPYRLGRIATFLDGSAGAGDEWDQINLALMSLGSGGPFGKGLGQSVGAFGWVPEALNDAIFPIIGETFGYVGVLAILIIFVALIIRVLSLADYLPNMFLRLVVAGAFAWITAQTVINIGAMTGVLPVTGITLPFLSFGGSSMLFLMLTMGVVFAISRYTSHRKNNFNTEGKGYEDPMRRRGVGRTRYASRRDY
ncbi:stage V sporulation protein E [Alphaproteobacteria bacterium]|nr:stage V sporulation protein E [Alphaproteobacteria bacterium]